MEVHELYQEIVSVYSDRDPSEKCPIIEMCYELISNLSLDSLEELSYFLQNDLSSKKWSIVEPLIHKVKKLDYSICTGQLFIPTEPIQEKNVVQERNLLQISHNKRCRVNVNKNTIQSIIQKMPDMHKYLTIENIHNSNHAMFPFWKLPDAYLKLDYHFADGLSCINQLVREKIIDKKVTGIELCIACMNSTTVNNFELFIVSAYYGFINRSDYIDILHESGLKNFLPQKYKPDKILAFFSDILRIMHSENK